MLIDRLVDKTNVVYTHKWMVPSIEKKFDVFVGRWMYFVTTKLNEIKGLMQMRQKDRRGEVSLKL